MSRASASRCGLISAGLLLGASLLTSPASGQVFFSDFNSGVPAGMSLFRDTNNVPLGSNAVVEAGFLKLTRAQGGAVGSAVIDDFGGGGAVTRFTATFKAALFGSTCCGGGAQPADGFSFNLVPATVALPPVFQATAAEEGMDSGLAVTFDTWDNGGGEAPAIEVKWLGTVVPGTRRAIQPSQSPVGAADAAAASKNVFINLDPDGKITVLYGSEVVCDRVQTPYNAQTIGAPKWILGGRTGGATDNHWVDDLRIVTVTPPKVVVPATAVWAYNDTTTAETTLHGTGWQGVAYDTNSAPGWKSGEALFGNDGAGLYDTAAHPFAGRGTNGFSTVLDRLINGAAARVTFYFRTKFNWPTSGAGVTLSATSWVDDGVVAYVNGTEAYRLRLADAPAVIDWTTLGSNPATEGAPENATWTAGSLVQGENVIAVELHQSSAGSSDAAFAMAISANQPVPPTIASAIEPTNRTVFASRSTTLQALAYGAPALSYRWFKDGVAIDPAGNPTATSASFEIPVMGASDAGDYYCVVSNVLGTATTRTAAVGYVNDPNPPVMVRAVAAATFDSIIVEFDELIDPNSVIDPFAVSVSGASVATVGPGPGGRSALITLDPPLSADTVYTVTMSDVRDIIGNTIVAGSSIDFRTFVNGPGGGILFEAFPGIAGNLVNDLIAHPSFPNSPTDRISIAGFNSRQAYPDDSHETYGARMRGLFIPPVSGNWVFYMAADDGSRLLFNPNGADAAGRQTLLNRDACCGDYSSANSRTAPQALIAGRGYYIELLYKEGGGGDWGQVAATLQGEPVPALTSFIPGSQLGVPSAPAGVGGVITITQQPVSVSLEENRTYSFSVVASNPNGLPQSYQWQRNGADIPGATGPTYSGLSARADDGAKFSARVVMIGNSVLSSEATLSVVVDDDAPVLVGATTDDTLKSVVINFDELIDGTSVDPFGFTVSGREVQNAVMGPNGRSVVLTVTPLLAENTQYTVTASGVSDRAGSPNTIGTLTTTVKTLAFHRGFLNFSVYNGTAGPTTAGTIPGNSINDLIGHPSYPGFPSERLFAPAFDTRTVFPNDSHEAYGGRLSGFFIPPTSGNWVFHLNADDGSRLVLNPNGPSPDGAVELTALDLCCAAFGVQFSTPQALVAGQRYYIEAIYKEGGGGDYGRVAAQLSTDTTPPTSLLPIPGAYLGALIDGTGASVNITQQPANQTFVIASDSLLAEDFTSSGGGFAVETPNAFNAPWTHNSASGSWEVVQDGAEASVPMTSMLTSPELTVTKNTSLTVRFSHRYSFEIDSTRWDGGNLQISVNGGPFTVVPDSAFAQNGYGGNTVGSGSRSVLANQPAFTGNSANFEGGPITSQASLGSFAIGDKVKIRFVYGGDTNTRGQFVPSWQISSVNVDQGAVQSVTFTVAATATRPGSNPAQIAYQWYRDSGSGFALIPGATSTSYTVVPRCDDTGDRFRVEVLTPGATAMSTAASLTVAVPNTAPSFGLTAPPAGAEDSGPVTVPSVARNIAPGTAAAPPSGQRINVFTPGDPLVAVMGVNDGDGASGAPPGAEGAAQAIDGVTQKYLNFLDLGSGFAATPVKGATIVTGARFYTANDAEERDPASYVLEGSTAGIDGPWTVISSGALTLPATRNPGGTTPVSATVHANQAVDFANTAAFTSYRVTFPTLKNAASANSMQIGEVELLGTIVLPKTNVLSAADAVVVVSGSNDGDTASGAPPANEGVARAIDGTTQKYLNFLDLGSGFVVTPNVGSTLITGIRLFTANDADVRDPASYVIEGSNTGADGPWTVVASGPLALPAGRNPAGQPIDPATHFNQLVEFANTVAYTSYRVTFPTLKDAASANSMQIGEVQLIGGGFTPPSCGDESGQTVSFTVSNNNPSLFSTQPAISPNGTLTYTPAANQCGSAVVTVVAVDSGDTSFGGRNTSAPQTFTLNVACVNDCPTATGQSLAVDQGSSVNFQLAGSDIDSTALQYTVTQAPAHGVVVVQTQTGAATYTPAAGYSGPDSFMFQVTDGTCNSSAALVTINVRLVNTPPTAKIVATPLVDFSPEIVNKVLISCNGSNACVQLDGSLSSDRETATARLGFAWSIVPSPLPFSDDVTTEICLELGTQTILLTVTDAAGATGTDSLTIEVLSAGEAIDELITKINDSTVARKNKRPFIATLKAAAASAERGQNHTTANQLHALQNKIRAQIAPSNPTEAAAWISWTQSIIDALNRCGE